MRRRRHIAALAGTIAVGAIMHATAAAWPSDLEDLILGAMLPDNGEEWVHTIPGTRWDVCEDTPVLVNAPDSMIPVIADALATMNRISGARFRIVGYTGRVPSSTWALDGEKVPGGRWPAVAIAVTTEERTDMLSARGLGAAVANPSGQNYVTGVVILEAGTVEEWGAESDGIRRLLLHELGHLAGLSHAGEHTLMGPHVRRNGGPDGFTAAETAALQSNFACTA